MIDGIQVSDLLDISKTIARQIFENRTYVWEVLPDIQTFILKLGPTLNPDEYNKVGDDVWISKTAHIFPSLILGDPA